MENKKVEVLECLVKNPCDCRHSTEIKNYHSNENEDKHTKKLCSNAYVLMGTKCDHTGEILNLQNKHVIP